MHTWYDYQVVTILSFPRLRAGGVAQVVELLPSKCKALSLNPSSKKTKKQKKFPS
jgi:hypothetical protein